MQIIHPRRVLLADDFSSSSRAATVVSFGLSHLLGAELLAVHVVSRNALLRRATDGTSPLALDCHDTAFWLDALWRALQPVREVLSCDVAVLKGEVVPQIVQQARAWGADVIVMGTRIAGWRMGSLTEQVLLRAPCPVLAVPTSLPPASYTVQRVLVGVDFRQGWERPFECALGVARAAGAQLLCVHALDYFAAEAKGGEKYCQCRVPELQLDLSERARERLRKELPPEPVSFGGHEEIVVCGRPQQEILRVAKERQADLIVVGFEPERVVGSSLSGSTLWHVLRGMPCPVLAVPVS